MLWADTAAIIRDKGQILDIKLSTELHCILELSSSVGSSWEILMDLSPQQFFCVKVLWIYQSLVFIAKLC